MAEIAMEMKTGDVVDTVMERRKSQMNKSKKSMNSSKRIEINLDDEIKAPQAGFEARGADNVSITSIVACHSLWLGKGLVAYVSQNRNRFSHLSALVCPLFLFHLAVVLV